MSLFPFTLFTTLSSHHLFITFSSCRALGQKFLHGSLTSCASSSVMPIMLSLTLVNHSHTDFTLSTACCVTVVIQVHLFIFSFNRPLCPWLITTLVQFCCVFV
ncbi:hypothetical protein AAZX31_03G036500 [Glycine max]